MKKLLVLFLVSAIMIPASAQGIFKNISVQHADSIIKRYKDSSNLVVLDVSTLNEFVIGHVEKAINIDFYWSGFNDSVNKLDKNKIYIVCCRSGSRSSSAFARMQAMNFKVINNMMGGMNAWVAAGFKTVTGGSGVDVDRMADPILAIYPSPVRGTSYIEIKGHLKGDAEIEIIGITGQRFKQYKISDQLPIEINGSDFSSGVYWCRLKTSNGVVKITKFSVVN